MIFRLYNNDIKATIVSPEGYDSDMIKSYSCKQTKKQSFTQNKKKTKKTKTKQNKSKINKRRVSMLRCKTLHLNLQTQTIMIFTTFVSRYKYM